MAAPISIQLYTVRDLLANDYEGIVTQIAEKGYVGVEPAGFPGSTLDEAKALYDRLGLKVSSAHTGLPTGDNTQKAFDTCKALGCDYVVGGFGPSEFETLDKIKASCNSFNEAAANAAEAGLKFAIHNHWWEFIELDGRRVYQIMLEHLEPNVLFEIDTYWVQTGGADPAVVVGELGKRAPLLHIKDGPCVKDQAMTAVGTGQVGFPAIVEAAGSNVDWMIVELDRCDTDMMDAVMASYDYLVGNGLASGNK